jgi:hypothetical protein
MVGNRFSHHMEHCRAELKFRTFKHAGESVIHTPLEHALGYSRMVIPNLYNLSPFRHRMTVFNLLPQSR